MRNKTMMMMMIAVDWRCTVNVYRVDRGRSVRVMSMGQC